MRRIWLLLLLACCRLAGQDSLYMDLSGEWRQSTDDKPAYSEPGFDDSGWKRVQLPWTQRPLPQALWLRRSIVIPAWADTSQLALTLGSVAEGYEIYGNGVRFGTAAGLALDRMQIARPRSFAIPAGIGKAGETLVIAIRYRRPGVLGNTSFTNYGQGPYLLTYVKNAPVNAGETVLNELWMRRSSDHVLSAVQFTLATLLLLVWFAERKRKELALLAAYLISEAVSSTLTLSQMSPGSFPFRPGSVVLANLVHVACLGLLVEFAMAAVETYFLWLRMTVGLVVSISVISFIPGESQSFLPGIAILAALATGVTVVGWIKTVRRGGGIEQHALPLLLLFVIGFRILRNGRLGLPRGFNRFTIGHYSWASHLIAVVVLAFLMAVILVRRLVADRREKQRLTSELEAARVIQNLLLREPELEAAHLEAIYLPAQEVGGDFYYVLDRETLVIGDVSGKGLKAAMIVSLLIGVLRGTRDRAPAAVLACLNLALAEQLEGGFVTCCCARFEADGVVTIANAGHLLPWLDGVEVSAETGLPLGIAPDVTWPETRLTVGIGQSMTFVSDGVVEAANAKREMFGFERTSEISERHAGEIVDAARSWGQNDDITVVTVRRVAAAVTHA